MDVSNRQIAEAFLELSDTVVTEFVLSTYLDRLAGHSVDLLGVQAAGAVVREPSDASDTAAAPDPRTFELDSRVLQIYEGAGFDCLGTGVPVRCHDLTAAHTRWPWFARAARAAGFRSVYAFPMRRRERAIGTLEVFASSAVGLGDEDMVIGQALADIAAIGIVNEREVRSNGTLIDQLQGALDSRVAIEQAKGVLAERYELDMDTAFAALRRYARSHNARLLDVAQAVVSTPSVAAEVHAALQPSQPRPAAPGRGSASLHG